jgi:hypothetical protein
MKNFPKVMLGQRTKASNYDLVMNKNLHEPGLNLNDDNNGNLAKQDQ